MQWRTMIRATSMCVIMGALSAPVNADIVLFDIEANEQAWLDALASINAVAKGGWNFDNDPDYGLQGVDAPLTSKGSGPVSAGIITSDNIIMDTTDPDPVFAIAAVGPSEGHGNVSNAVVANTFNYAFLLKFTGQGKVALDFNAMTLVGDGGTVDLTVNGVFLANVVAPVFGHRWGLIATNGERIHEVMIYDPNNGFEGVQGMGLAYVPGPGALTMFVLVGGARRRRRH